MGGGTVWPIETMRAVTDVARARGLTAHMDGARLWNATAATGVTEADYAAPFDSVSVCFSKGLGAPVGSALCGTEAFVSRARRFKQLFGGGFRQAGIIAAGALHALEHGRATLAADNAKAAALAAGLAGIDGVAIDVGTVETNIVRFDVRGGAGSFVEACHDSGVHMLPVGRSTVRAVTHRDVSMEDMGRVREVISAVLTSA